MPNIPENHEKKVTGQGKDVYKRGEGLGTGPVGKQDAYQGRKQQYSQSSGGGSQKRSSGGGLLKIIVLAVLLLGGGGAGLSGLLGGGSSTGSNSYTSQPAQTYTSQQSQGSTASAFNLSSLLGSVNSTTTSSGWVTSKNTGKLDKSIASGARDKFTTIKGSGKDTVTIMVYMCGADLESKSGLATADLQEMANATISDKVNIIVYTGGASKWNNSIISSKTNQIYKVEQGGLKQLSKDEGSKCMTDPATLTGFINYCVKNYKADRYDLIFWDHGGGSLTGYGYDEKFTSKGSMGLSGINQALNNAGIKFDFVGFDACLMATAETGLMLSNYADYMIASEEVEAGYGWYYTNWITNLSKNTSMPTIEIGQKIVDDFVDSCAQKVPSQKATLSLTDLAELAATLPAELVDFATSTTELIKDSNTYATVSNARSSCREYSTSKIDQVDLVNLAINMGTEEGKALAEAVLGAVKYNRTSNNIDNSYGLSIYFPMSKPGNVKNAVNTYDAIGMDDEYSRCIQAFAGVTGSAQSVQSSAYSTSSNPYSAIFNGLLSTTSGGSSNTSGLSTDLISALMGGSSSGSGSSASALSSLLGGSNMTSLLTGLLSDRSVISEDEAAAIIEANSFNADNLIWSKNGDVYQISLSQEQWDLVRNIEVNVFYDDGEGFIDLGLDNLFTVSEEGALQGDYDDTWPAINNQPVAFYYVDTTKDGSDYSISCRVPALLNGDRVELILTYDNEHPDGFVSGANPIYANGETETSAKSMVEIKDGDVIDFICDYYDYEGNYMDSYMLGDQMFVDGELEVSYVELGSANLQVTYVFTDLFAQEYWTPALPR
ncbi:MAG: clostripain-related cysteine peptidase [Clostridia bacterium]|nr:clostripain-related cysteine peptidase [Clostridia bacterium]